MRGRGHRAQEGTLFWYLWDDQGVLRHAPWPRAASIQGTGLTQRLPRKKGGGRPQVDVAPLAWI